MINIVKIMLSLGGWLLNGTWRVVSDNFPCSLTSFSPLLLSFLKFSQISFYFLLFLFFLFPDSALGLGIIATLSAFKRQMSLKCQRYLEGVSYHISGKGCKLFNFNQKMVCLFHAFIVALTSYPFWFYIINNCPLSMYSLSM